jgi:hypothetical protein
VSDRKNLELFGEEDSISAEPALIHIMKYVCSAKKFRLSKKPRQENVSPGTKEDKLA